MRLVVQRTTSAQVNVGGEVVGRLQQPGLTVLIGVAHTDTPDVARSLAAKLWTLRILPDERSCADNDAPILVVSQFTLYGDVRKGRRPSWSAAAPREVSEPLVNEFVAALRELGATVETGRFGQHMEVAITNDGPFTLVLDT